MPEQLTAAQLEGRIAEIAKAAVGATIDEWRKEMAERTAANHAQMKEMFSAFAPATKTSATQKGILLGQLVRCVAAAKHHQAAGIVKGPAAIAKEWYGEGADVTKALSSSDLSSGGAFVPQELQSEIIELLRPASVVRSLNPTVMPLVNGTLDIPKLTGGAVAGYIGENQNVPKTEQTTGNVKASAKKLAALVPLSNDWLRRSLSTSDAVIRDDTIAAIAQRGDLSMIRGLGTEHSPKGLRYQAAAGNIIPANATVNLANVTADLGKLWLALAQADVRFLRPGWIMAPRTLNYLMTVRDGNGNYAFREELLTGKLWGFPYKFTSQIPVNLGGGTDESELYFADFADVVVAEEGGVEVTASQEAAYHDGTELQAAFSRDQTVIRAIAQHDLATRHAESIAVLTGVKWIA
jgi:HK97 family phage major capsid protein